MSVNLLQNTIPNLSNMPEYIIMRIMRYFQTFKDVSSTEKITKKVIYKDRLNSVVDTDYRTIMNLARTNRYFYSLLVESQSAKITWNIFYNSFLLIGEISCHTSLCNKQKCT